MGKNKLLIVLLIFCFCCKPNSGDDPKPGDPNVSNYDRPAILQHVADDIVIPSYQNFKVKLDSLISKGDSFTSNPTSTNLLDLRNAWASAYIEWQKVELFNFGPAENNTLRSFFNIYPTNVSGIESFVAARAENLETTISYSRQGFPALDYLINGLGQTDEEILVKYTSDPLASNRLRYLGILLQQMGFKFNFVLRQWTGYYRQTFIDNSSTQSTGSISIMTNTYIENYEKYIRTAKFGIPSGVFSNGNTNPQMVEAFYKKDLSLQLAKTAHQASVDFFNGKSVKTGNEGPSLKTALNALDAKSLNSDRSLAKDINAQFAVVKGKLDLLSPDLHQEVITNREKMVDVFNEMQKEVLLLKGDMPSALSVTITYADTDGD